MAEETHNVPDGEITEAQGLNTQHSYLQEIFGSYLHPSVHLHPDDETIKIATINTGAGIWLLEEARKTSEYWWLYGFDPSAPRAHPNTDEPRNVFFIHQDPSKPFPREFHSFFDVIAIRLLAVTLRVEDWRLVCENVKQCLKPGGYLQWIEPDYSPTGWRTIALKPGCQANALQESIAIVQSLGQLDGKDFSYARQLPNLFRLHGFADVLHRIIVTDKEEMRIGFTADMAMAFIPWCKQHAQKLGITIEQAVKFGEDAKEQALKGEAYNCMDFHIVVGRKRLVVYEDLNSAFGKALQVIPRFV